MFNKTLNVRYWDKVNKHGPIHPKLKTRCWLWKGAKNAKGYGQIKVAGEQTGAHVVAWFFAYGNWPIQQVLHKCDNRPCVNPSHLFEGTHQDNMDDKVAKGRQAKGDQIPLHRNPELAQGENNPCCKLTASIVQTIRSLYKRGGRGCTINGPTQKQLAAEHGITQEQVGRIIRGESWGEKNNV